MAVLMIKNESSKILFNDLIGKAVDSIKIAMPYFIPDEETLSALRRAALVVGSKCN